MPQLLKCYNRLLPYGSHSLMPVNLYITKKTKIILSVLALISAGLSLSIFFDWNPFIKSSIKKEDGLKSITSVSPKDQMSNGPVDYPDLKEIPVETEDALFSPPVEQQYLEAAVLNEENPQSLSFFLDNEVRVKAIFNGKVRTVFQDEKDLSYRIIIDSEDGQYQAGYIVFGEPLVLQGDMVKEGQQIARAAEQKTDFYPITNLTFWIRNKDNNLIKLSGDLFKSE